MTQRRSAQRVVHTPACEPHAVHSQMVSGGLDNFYGFFFNRLGRFSCLEKPTFPQTEGGHSFASWFSTHAVLFIGKQARIATLIKVLLQSTWYASRHLRNDLLSFS